MKLLIGSDIHGSAQAALALQDVFKKEKADKLILLGDLLYHGPRNNLPEDYSPKEVARIFNTMKESIMAVRGNCDAEVDQMMLEFPMMAEYMLLCADEQPVYVCHGHQLEDGKQLPWLQGQVVLHGHTHIGRQELVGGCMYLNPGSAALPKDGHYSYMIYEKNVFTRLNFDKEVLGEWRVSPITSGLTAASL